MERPRVAFVRARYLRSLLVRVEANELLSRTGDVARFLNQDGHAYIAGLRTAERLAGLGRMLGSIVPAGVGMSNDLHSADSYEIRVRNDGAGVLDKFGKQIVSTTAQAFEFHTDGYNRAHPPRYVLLLRTDCSDELPESFFADVHAVLHDAAYAELVDRLCDPIYPSANGPQSVVFDRDACSIRFNPLEMDRWSGVHTDRGWREPVKALLSLIGEDPRVDCLRPGDAVMLDNWRVCHARSELRRDSERTVLRMWVD